MSARAKIIGSTLATLAALLIITTSVEAREIDRSTAVASDNLNETGTVGTNSLIWD